MATEMEDDNTICAWHVESTAFKNGHKEWYVEGGTENASVKLVCTDEAAALEVQSVLMRLVEARVESM